MCILRNDMPHAPLGVLHITLVAGNDVYMYMENTLPGRGPYIHADIVAIRFKFLINELFLFSNQLHAGSHLVWRQVKKAGDMTTRDDHAVPRAHRIGIASAVCKFILQRQAFRISAKQAWVIRVSLFL